jgi:hypothetical protein
MDSHQGSDAVIRKSQDSPQQLLLRGAWRGWGEALRRRHLDGVAALLLEAAKPIALVSAQFLHMGRPFFGQTAFQLARLLESDTETLDFIAYLESATDTDSATQRGDG